MCPAVMGQNPKMRGSVESSASPHALPPPQGPQRSLKSWLRADPSEGLCSTQQPSLAHHFLASPTSTGLISAHGQTPTQTHVLPIRQQLGVHIKRLKLGLQP